MQEEKNEGMSRRYFTAASAMAVLAGVVVTLTDCGGSDSSPTAPSSPAPSTGASDVSGTVSANHGHVAKITRAQLTAGGAISLDIRGTASHPHTVSLSQAEVALIAAGQRISKASSNDDGHTHDVTFN
jgi:hypothetical protein